MWRGGGSFFYFRLFLSFLPLIKPLIRGIPEAEAESLRRAGPGLRGRCSSAGPSAGSGPGASRRRREAEGRA